MGKKNLYSLITIVVITLTVVYTMLNNNMWQNENRVIFWDVKSYYAYLPAIVIHGDPNFNFVERFPETYGDKYWLEVVDNGNKLVITSMGMSMLYLPFFLMGHVTALLTGFDATGYTYPYFAFMLLGSVFYLTLGLWFLRKLLLNYYHDGVVAATLASIFFGTNLLWYSTFEATMSHVYSFALFAAFIWFTRQWHTEPDWRSSVLIGLIYGLITVVRPTNAVIALFFVFFSIGKPGEIFQKAAFFLRNYKYLIVLIITAILVLAPQLIYWKYITGHWIVNSYGDKGIFYFDNPQIFNGLFSYRKGLFVYAPVILVAFLSLPALLSSRTTRKYFIPIIFFSAANIYIILSWWVWWYGGSFGLRAFIESFAMLAIPLAAGIDYLWKKKTLIRIPAMLVIAIFVLYGLFANVQYYYGAIHWDSMSKDAFWDSFGSRRPSANFYNLIDPPNYKQNFTINDYVLCNAEKIDLGRNKFKSTSKVFFFDGVEQISTERAFSGKNSILLNHEQPFGFTTKLGYVLAGERYDISVKRFPADGKGCIVAQAQDANLWYQTQSAGVPAQNSEWEEMVLTVVIPDFLNGQEIIVYCYNPLDENAWYDDIKISIERR